MLGLQLQALEVRVQVEHLQQQFQALVVVNRLQRAIKLHHKAFRR